MKRRLTASQAGFLQEMVRGLPMGMAVIHLANPKNAKTWKLVARNAVASRLVGSTVADFLALPVVDRLQEHEPSIHAALFRQVLAKRAPRALGRMRSKSELGAGEVWEVQACPLANNCVGVVFEDVSRQKQTLRQLMDVESRLEQMRESARAIQWRADPVTFEFAHVSKEARTVLGYGIERWRTESNFWKTHSPADSWELVHEECRKAAQGEGSQEFECRMFHADGRMLWFHAYVQFVSLRSGRTELSGLLVDITDQKRTEESARLLSIRVMKAQEEDRKRISRELHDSIGQFLTSLKLGIADVSSDEQCSDAIREKLNECARLVRICMEEIRSVSNLLHPPLLDILGLVPALRWYARYFSERSAISLELDTPQEMERLDQDTELALFRIFQECLTNIQRHAQTSHAKVRLSGDDQAILLEVEDSGIGMPPDIFQQLEIRGGGIGLFKMRERVAELFGKLEFHSSGKGTLVRARIPKSKARATGPAHSDETRRSTPKRLRSE